MAQYSFRLPNADYLGFPATPEAIVETACKAEELGFDALFVNDHVIVDDSPRSALWRNVYDPLMVLSYVAARTTQVLLGTSVLIMPYPQPHRHCQDGRYTGPDVRWAGHRRSGRGLERGRVSGTRSAP